MIYKKKISYSYLHATINAEWGQPNFCEHCKSTEAKRYDWAKKKHCQYKLSRKNFLRLCNSCHRKYDYTIAKRKIQVLGQRKRRLLERNIIKK